MLPLYTTRIEDLGQGDFVKVDWPPAFNVALLTPEALLLQVQIRTNRSPIQHQGKRVS
jgi:hypothetical protein